MVMNFYEKPLSELTAEEWEQICMKCGKCCMCKYSEGDVIHFSNYMCRFFDVKKCRCSCYNKRFEMAEDDCKKVTLDLLEDEIYLLPPSCAYRSLYEGRGLPAYHPLLTKDAKSVEKAGESVKTLAVVSENGLEETLEKALHKAVENHWSEKRLMRKVAQIEEKFKLRWLFSYQMT